MTKALLVHYRKIVEFLGTVLGPDYEVALHDLSSHSREIVAIANGQVSGRTVGAPLTDLALKMLVDREYESRDFRANHKAVSKDGKVLRSSTLFIKDESGKPSGMLCVNFDGSKYAELSDRIMQLCHPNEMIPSRVASSTADLLRSDTVENLSDSISETTEKVLKESLADFGVPVDRLTQEEKLSVVGRLDRKGVFLLKGAVGQVARELRCSEPSVYRYIAKLHRERGKKLGGAASR